VSLDGTDLPCRACFAICDPLANEVLGEADEARLDAAIERMA
jgi:hypothetical protein